MNMAGNIAGGVAPVVVGYILQTTGHNWLITFWLSALIYVLGALCWVWIDPVTPLSNESDGADPLRRQNETTLVPLTPMRKN
jgi:nitrate/nitrite transporter NarK